MIMGGYAQELDRVQKLIDDKIIDGATVTVELDVAFGEVGGSLDKAISALTADTAVTSRVLVEHGPGGGWPVVEFHGTPGDVLVLLRRYFVNDGDMNEYFS
jgi:hypothetical protein